MGVLPAHADLCDVLLNIYHLEIGLRDGQPHSEAEFDQLMRLGTLLDGFHFKVADVSEAVHDYTRSLFDIHSPNRALAVSERIREHKTVTHRFKLRTMRAHTVSYCGDSQTLPSAAQRWHESADRVMHIGPFKITLGTIRLVEMLIVLGALFVFATLWLAERLRRQRSQKARYVCNAETQLHIGGDTITTRALDISGVGLKIQLLEDVEIPPRLKVQIGDITVDARLTWQNTHFAGLQLSPALPRKLVRSVSTNPVKRRRKKR